MTSFESLGINASLLRAVSDMGFLEPMPIQVEVIPPALEAKDILGRSQTGTGKTAAFGLPLLQRLLPGGSINCRAVIVAPTRELASQVHGHLVQLAAHTAAKGILVVGGESAERQEDALRRGCDWIVATPGRLRDHLQRGYLSMDAVETFVLDEADQLLELGFVPDIKAIASFLPERRQTMLFSATLPREIENLTRRLMHSPVRIEIGEERVAEPVSQEAWPVAARQKYALLIAILQRRGWKRVLIFCRTRARAEKLHERLVAEGMPSGILHADRPMADRRSVMLAFRGGEIQYLVATDLAARGLDIAEIDHVVNFDVPVAPEDYIHRVGRTGRAGQPGVALSLVSDAELVLLTRIEYRLHYQIPVKRLDDFVYDSEVAGATRKIRSRERKPTDPNARLFSTERKESPFTRTGKARRATNIERGDATKPARIKKKLPHQRRRRG